MNTSEKNQEKPLALKNEILNIFKSVGVFLKQLDLTEALPTITSHFKPHLDQAFLVKGSNSPAAPVYFLDSIISEYFLFRPFPDDPNKEGFVETENNRFLRATTLLIVDELYKKFDCSQSKTLSNPQFIEGFRETRLWLGSMK